MSIVMVKSMGNQTRGATRRVHDSTAQTRLTTRVPIKTLIAAAATFASRGVYGEPSNLTASDVIRPCLRLSH